MSTNVEVCAKKPIKIDLWKICRDKYYYGVRNIYDIVQRGDVDNRLVFFDFTEMGRGVEFTFVNEKKVEIRINTPASTSDLELFMYLIQEIIKISKANEVICEDEAYSTDAIEEIRKIAKINMKSGLDLLLHPPTDDIIEIIAVQGPIAIDDEERRQFVSGQKAFDKYLDKKQRLPGTNEILIPIIGNTDGGSFWFLSLKAGRYIIIPRHARPRNKNMKVDHYSVFYADSKKVIDYKNFLKEVDMSRRYDAERSIVKLSKKQLQEIFDKYPDSMEEQHKSHS